MGDQKTLLPEELTYQIRLLKNPYPHRGKRCRNGQGFKVTVHEADGRRDQGLL